eukprot:scaffold7892_cov116-Skeletonema_marinoi.AAC.2
MHNLLTTSTVPAAALPGVLGAIAVFRLEYCIHAKVIAGSNGRQIFEFIICELKKARRSNVKDSVKGGATPSTAVISVSFFITAFDRGIQEETDTGERSAAVSLEKQHIF